MPSISLDSLPQPSHSFAWTQEPWGVALRCLPLLEAAPHLFTTRSVDGTRGDARELDGAAASLGMTRGMVVQVRQVHSCRVALVHAAADSPSADTDADALVSDDPDRAVAVRVADCAPILIADRVRGVVAAVHAGWRGTACGVTGAAVETMVAAFGSSRAGLVAAIGPSIRSCCYEVGPQVRGEFLASGQPADLLEHWFNRGRGDRWQLDVPRANFDQLLASGLPEDAVFDSGLCTHCHPRLFHSYRRDGAAAGRMLGIIRVQTGQEGRSDRQA